MIRFRYTRGEGVSSFLCPGVWATLLSPAQALLLACIKSLKCFSEGQGTSLREVENFWKVAWEFHCLASSAGSLVILYPFSFRRKQFHQPLEVQ